MIFSNLIYFAAFLIHNVLCMTSGWVCFASSLVPILANTRAFKINFLLLLKMAAFVETIYFFAFLVYSLYACKLDMDCRSCISANCRFFKGKDGLRCVKTVLPQMHPRQIFKQSDCEGKDTIICMTFGLNLKNVGFIYICVSVRLLYEI